MKKSRAGMTLFELLIVMTIVGIVYSIGIFTLKKENITSPTLTILTLKTTLLSLGQSSEIRLICGTSCQECQVVSNDGKVLTDARLQSKGTISRYGFNRYGELQVWGKTVTHINGNLSQECFEFSLHPDGTVTPLILKNNDKFYAYIPLGDDKPYITESEEDLRKHIFDESLYPLRGDETYGIH
jgi:prepilin-type N-terminal cleavage/methylation domain-containing protein